MAVYWRIMADVPLKKEDQVPTPLEFADKEELITRLKADAESLANWFETRYEDVGDIVWYSGGSNTFRAFAHMPRPPSQVYYDWTQRMYRSTSEPLLHFDVVSCKVMHRLQRCLLVFLRLAVLSSLAPLVGPR